jgi:hypothetical protein
MASSYAALQALLSRGIFRCWRKWIIDYYINDIGVWCGDDAMSDTPRTDVAQHNMGSIVEPHYVVDVEVAQGLERELAEAKKDAERLLFLVNQSGEFYYRGYGYQMTGKLRLLVCDQYRRHRFKGVRKMSDTPRTDIAQHNMGSVAEPHYVVDVEVAQGLERELAEAKKNAERYRWLRDHAQNTLIGVYEWVERDGRQQMAWLASNELDAAIDAAMKEGK